VVLALNTIFSDHVFVGLVGPDSPLSLIQHGKKLFQVNHTAVAEELFYQLGLKQFGKFHRLELDPPPALKQLVKLAVDDQDEASRGSRSVDELVTVSSPKRIISQKNLTRRCFS